MTDDILMAVASALAAKAADTVAESARGAWAKLVRLVRERFCDDGQASAALDAAWADPGNGEAVHELAASLERLSGSDQEFGARLRALWQQVGPLLRPDEGSAVNVVTGTVGGHLIQASDIQVQGGGLHLGDVHGPPGT